MPTLRELRLQARLSENALAKRAGISNVTVARAESGSPIQDVKAYALAEALSKALKREIKMEDIEGLVIM